MALPNQEIWGDKTSWVTDPVPLTGGYSGTEALKNIRPMMANFSPEQTVGNRSGCLAIGRDIAHVFQFGTPIDETICPCGQDPTISAYGKIDVFHNKQGAEQNKIPDYENVYENENINWFFHSFVSVNQPMRWGTINIDSTNQQWTPNGEDISGGIYNNNNYITPWTYFMNKSILLSIYVMIGTSAETYAITLAEWKNNHSNEKIRGAILRINLCTAGSDNQDNYAYGDSQYSYGRALGFSLMNAVNNGSSEIVDYATFDYERQGYIPLITRYIRGNGYDTTTRYYMFGYHNLEDVELKTVWYQGADDGYQIYPEIPYSEFNYEQIMKMAACFGVPFTPTNKLVFNKMFYDEDLYLPIIDENGVTHGEYTHGVANLTNPQYQNDSIRDIDYDPTKPPKPVDPNTYSNQTYFNPLINLASATKRYVLTAANVEQLMRDLWTISDSLVHTDPDEPYKDYTSIALDNFLVNSPIQCIVSLDKYPINNIPTGTQAEAIPLGKTTVPNGAIGKPLTKTTMEFNFASVDIFPRFGGCFLDYEPYTHYELYVPFCGTTQINASDILGHKLSVIEIVDFTTGTVTAYIMADNLAISTISGNCAISIPLSGTDTTMINAEINNALITAKSTQLQSKLTGKVGGLIGNLPRTVAKTLTGPLSTYTDAVQDKWNTELADYNLNHIETPMHLIGSASPVGMWSLEMKCRLMCYYPTGDVINSEKPPSLIADKITEFGNMQGFATVDTGKVSDYHGFTMGALRTEGIACTENERQRLKALFATGVILP